MTENIIPSSISIERERQAQFIKELSAHVGKQAQWSPRVWGKDKVIIDVMIIGVDLSFGGTYTIRPMAGSGNTKVRKDGLVIK